MVSDWWKPNKLTGFVIGGGDSHARNVAQCGPTGFRSVSPTNQCHCSKYFTAIALSMFNAIRCHSPALRLHRVTVKAFMHLVHLVARPIGHQQPEEIRPVILCRDASAVTSPDSSLEIFVGRERDVLAEAVVSCSHGCLHSHLLRAIHDSLDCFLPSLPCRFIAVLVASHPHSERSPAYCLRL